jgi:ferredoxin
MAKYKININLDDCIGAYACAAVYPEMWEVDEKGKAHPKMGTLKKADSSEWIILDETEFDLELAKRSAEVCPVNAIKIEKIK